MPSPEITGLPHHLGVADVHAAAGHARAVLIVGEQHAVPGDPTRVHAGALVTLGDTVNGFGCLASLPDGAKSFATSMLTSSHTGTARVGDVLEADAIRVHGGRSTQLWDATVRVAATGRVVALVRCLQQLLY